MANRTLGASAPALPLIGNLYAIAPGKTREDVFHQLDTRLAQLSAILGVCYGVTGSAFREDLPAEVQDGILWACADLASESQDLLSAMSAMKRQGE